MFFEKMKAKMKYFYIQMYISIFRKIQCGSIELSNIWNPRKLSEQWSFEKKGLLKGVVKFTGTYWLRHKMLTQCHFLNAFYWTCSADEVIHIGYGFRRLAVSIYIGYVELWRGLCV